MIKLKMRIAMMGYKELCIQKSAQTEKVAALELEVYRLAREKRWEGARTEEGKRIARRELVEVDLEYKEAKELYDALESAARIAHRKAIPLGFNPFQ